MLSVSTVSLVKAERGVERIAVRRILEQLAVGNPPGVLDAGDELHDTVFVEQLPVDIRAIDFFREAC